MLSSVNRVAGEQNLEKRRRIFTDDNGKEIMAMRIIRATMTDSYCDSAGTI